jgi:hypothetical protein
MLELTAKRTLVKSPPELWEELSEVERLAKHLGAFGEIKISKVDPEHTVAWEGEHASGTVSIEPSGWGTRVTLTAELPTSQAEAVEQVAEAYEPVPAQPAPPSAEPPRRRRGFWARLLSSWRVPEERVHRATSRERPVERLQPAQDDATRRPEEPSAPPPAEEPQTAIDPEQAESVLHETLDALGSAHHRPFSRP